MEEATRLSLRLVSSEARSLESLEILSRGHSEIRLLSRCSENLLLGMAGIRLLSEGSEALLRRCAEIRLLSGRYEVLLLLEIGLPPALLLLGVTAAQVGKIRPIVH